MQMRIIKLVKRTIFASTLFFIMGCNLLGDTNNTAFTESWHKKTIREQQERIRSSSKEEIVLLGRPGGARTTIHRDEKGNPQLGLGGTSGLGADVRMNDGDPEIRLRYRINIGGNRRSLRDTLPRSNPETPSDTSPN